MAASASLPALVFSPAQLDGANGFVANGPIAFDFSGNAVSAAGDLNGDGIDDVLIGAFGEADDDRGRIDVVFGKDSLGGPAFPAVIELSSLGAGDGFSIRGTASDGRAGTALASIGDVNGDGFGDILIGARGNARYAFGNGAAYVVFGRDTTQPGNAFPNPFELESLPTGGGVEGFAMYGIAQGDAVGAAVAGGFDLNGDGLQDFVVGAYGVDGNGTSLTGGSGGEAYVIFGRDTSIVGNFPASRQLPDLASGSGADGFVLRGVGEGDSAGAAVASAGDVNGDGFDDLIIGARRSAVRTGPAQAFIVFGRDASVSGAFPPVFELSSLAGGGGVEGFVINGIAAPPEIQVGSAGDINDDGVDDLVVAERNTGQSFVVFGRDTSLVGNFPSQIEASSLAGGAGIEGFVLDGAGFDVGRAGDFNGDAIDDLFALSGSDGYLLYGRDVGVSGNFPAVFDLTGLAADPGPGGLVIEELDFGDSIDVGAPAGDLNGDGRVDLVLGASEADPNGGNSGETYVIFSPGRVNTPPTVSTPSTAPTVPEDNPLMLGPGFGVADAEGDPQSVTLSFDFGNSDNARLFLSPQPGVAIAGNNTEVMTLSGSLADINAALPQVVVELPPDENGAPILILRSSDGFFVGEGFSNLVFQPVNDPPVFTVTQDPLTLLEDAGFVDIEGFLVDVGAGDPEVTGFFDADFTTSTSNPALFDAGPFIGSFTFVGRTADLSLFLNPDISGSAEVTVTLNDNGGTFNGGVEETTDTFDIVVLPVNDAPVFTLSGDVTVDEDAGPQSIDGFAGSIDDGDPDQVQALQFGLSSDNPGLFASAPTLSAAGTLTFTTAPDANGSALVTATLTDDGGTDNGGVNETSQTFTITVNALNDAPSFTPGPDPSVLDTDGAVTVSPWATEIDPGAPDEAGQDLAFQIVGNTAPTLFASPPVVAPDGSLSFTPAFGAEGTTLIDLVLSDDGPDGAGNVSTSDPQQAAITITLAPSADLSIRKGNGVAQLETGELVSWVIEVENLGPEDVTGALVEDPIPATVANAEWTCQPFGGASCTAMGDGDLLDNVDLPAGSRVEYVLSADVVAMEGEVVENTAEVVPPVTPIDRSTTNNRATDSDPIALFIDGFETAENE